MFTNARELLNHPNTVFDTVLGGGGIKGFGHCGFLKCLQDLRIRVGTVYGVSIGSACAALYTNGFPPEEIAKILFEEIGAIDKSELSRFLWRPNPIKLWKHGGFFDLHDLFSRLVRKYELVPNNSLAIISYSPGLRKPVVFRGKDYDLAEALSASCALPLFMKSRYAEIKGVNRRLLDGGIYHNNPDQFCQRPAIISALGLARRLPHIRLSWVDWFLHLGEMLCGPFKEAFTRRRYKRNSIFVQTGMLSVATMTFNINEAVCNEMIAHAYAKTQEILFRLKGEKPAQDAA